MSESGDVLIAASLLASDFGRLAEAAIQAAKAGADLLHFDVMDGQFVPNITMGPAAVAALRPTSTLPFDVHLMIVDPERFIDAFVEAGADRITVHAEACVHLQRVLSRIREAGARAGVALNPATPPDHIEFVREDLDHVLVMTVNPGFGGQRFLPATVEKIRDVAAMVATDRRAIRLEVDGGIDRDTAGQVIAAGADILVAGTAIYDFPDGVGAGIRALRQAASRTLAGA